MTASPIPFCRLALRTSPLKCVPSIQNRLRSLFHSFPNRLLCERLIQMSNLYHPHRRKHRTSTAFGQDKNTIQSP
jgi:hypothetical protein